MKSKIIVILLAGISLLGIGCAVQNDTNDKNGTKNNSSPPVGPKQVVDGVQGLLTLHPIENSAKSKDERKFYFIFDYVNQCIYITDQEEVYKQISDFLTVDISVGHAVLVQAVLIDPFTLFQLDELQRIANQEGMDITTLNSYKVGKIFNIGTLNNSAEAKRLLLDALQNKTGSTSTSSHVQGVPQNNNQIKSGVNSRRTNN